MSSATWLAAAKPTVQPDRRSNRRTAGWRGWKRHRSSMPARRIDGSSATAMAATPAVVPRPRRYTVSVESLSACAGAHQPPHTDRPAAVVTQVGEHRGERRGGEPAPGVEQRGDQRRHPVEEDLGEQERQEVVAQSQLSLLRHAVERQGEQLVDRAAMRARRAPSAR